MYPVLGPADDEEHLIELEELDGPTVERHSVKSIYVKRVDGGKTKYLKRVQDVKADLYVTDARVAVACEKFDKGGGWVGFSATGWAVAAVANAGSKALVARRRRGKLLVGQARYPWVSTVEFTAKSGLLTSEEVSLTTRVTEDGQDRTLELTCTLARGESATSVAHSIARRCAEFRLAHGQELSEQARERFERILGEGPRQPKPKRIIVYSMPSYFRVSPKTAYPRGAQDA